MISRPHIPSTLRADSFRRRGPSRRERVTLRILPILLAAAAAWIAATAGCSRLPKHRLPDDLVNGPPLSDRPSNSDTPDGWLARSRSEPSHQRLWRSEYVLLPYADYDGHSVTIHNVRNNAYRTEEDLDVRHYDLTFAMSEVTDVDFIVVPFQATGVLAHTMLSFGLTDGRRFVVSVEARLEKGEVYSATAGAQNGFELMYVIGDERDLIALRTEVRKVDCFVYPTRATPEDSQRLLADVLERVNKIAAEPEFYNTLLNNCTTNLVDHANRLRKVPIQYQWRVLLTGYSDSLAYDLGLLDIPQGNFDVVRPAYRINPWVPIYMNSPDFARNIRRHLPKK